MRENCQDAALTEAQEAAKNAKKEKIIIIVIVFNIVFLVLINSIPLVIYDWFRTTIFECRIASVNSFLGSKF